MGINIKHQADISLGPLFSRFSHTSLVLLSVVGVHKATELVLCSVISRNHLSLTFGEHLIEAIGSD